MSMAHVAAIANAVLYEGYILYPYRPSSLKNQQRWSFGAIFPRDYADARGGDPWTMQVQCLVHGSADAEVTIRARFLHLIAREIGRLDEPPGEWSKGDDPAYTPVASIDTGDELLIPWDEAVEREIAAPPLALGALADAPETVTMAIPSTRDIEPVAGDGGQAIGVIVRTAQALDGNMEISAEAVRDDVWRITVRTENRTPVEKVETLSRDAAQRWAFASLHTVFQVKDGAFVSLTDPPDDLCEAAGLCDNQGVWPVLVGEEGDTDIMLASPIILPDHPEIAPESPGDLFDGCEIDEILTLRILTMTDAEKREMAATDPRVKAMLERTEALGAQEMAGLHGTIRQPERRAAKPRLATINVAGREIAVGDRVRLKPKAGGDVMDVVLAGMEAIVEGIERDFEDRVHLAVTIADDPGREFGSDRFPGHRFFFGIDEVDLIGAEAAA